MKIKSAEFLKSVFIDDNKVFFDERKEVVFVWRSNVWKSSIINRLLNKKDLVKISKKPWKTKTANIFLVNKKYYFTDLPWYWFAKLWKETLEKLDAINSWYIWERKQFIKNIILLVDSKIGLQEKDIDMFNYIQELNIPIIILLSKIDRLSKSEIEKAKSDTEKKLFWQKVFGVSSHKKIWTDEILKEISRSLEVRF